MNNTIRINKSRLIKKLFFFIQIQRKSFKILMIKEIPQNKHLHNLAFSITPLPYLFRTSFFFLFHLKNIIMFLLRNAVYIYLKWFSHKTVTFTNRNNKKRKEKEIMECLKVGKKNETKRNVLWKRIKTTLCKILFNV